MKQENSKNGNIPLLPWAVLAVISGALFSGHFGVGDVIFPPILGRDSGQAWFIASLGYGIINSLGVLVAYLAVAQKQQTLLQMTSDVLGKRFGIIFTTICMLIIGPVFILPRVSSATHEMSVMPFFPNFPLWITLAIFFGLNLYVVYNRSQVIDRLGKVLTPVLIIFMLVLIIRGITSPLAKLPAYASKNPLIGGFLEGYNTMNALGATLFGGWILKELSMRGIKKKTDQAKNLKIIGPIVALALLFTSTGITYLGATTGAAYPDAEIGVLTIHIAEGLLGYIGKIIFAIILALACFTTSAGLTSTAGDVFEEMSGGKLQYKYTVIASSLVGFLLGLIGLSKIVGYTTPWLMLVYPALVVLLLSGLYKNFQNIKVASAAGIIAAILFSIGDFLSGLGFPGNILSVQIARLPLGTVGMGWVIPTIVVIIITQIVVMLKTKEKQHVDVGG
jgi:LIVCS family branched-chain amino acid:cation transporter